MHRSVRLPRRRSTASQPEIWLLSISCKPRAVRRSNDFRLLDAYAGVSFGRWTGTLGKQSLWWGPAIGGAFMESNNAEPIWMARLTNDVPYRIPILGKARLDMFYGKLQGTQPTNRRCGYTARKISVQPFKDVSKLALREPWSSLGADYPAQLPTVYGIATSALATMQTHTLRRTIRWLAAGRSGFLVEAAEDSGDALQRRLSVMMILLRWPSPHRSAFRPGLYIAQLPGAAGKAGPANGRWIHQPRKISRGPMATTTGKRITETATLTRDYSSAIRWAGPA